MKYFVRRIDEKLINSSLEGSKESGAYAMFIGKVRNDKVRNKTVKMIEYSSYNGMAEKIINRIEKNVTRKCKLKKLIIKHALGKVAAGGIAMMVSAEAAHRRSALKGVKEAVERVKNEVPIWKKEIFDDGSARWA